MGDRSVVRSLASDSTRHSAFRKPHATPRSGTQAASRDSTPGSIPFWEKAFTIAALLLAMWAVVPLLRLESRKTELPNYVTEGDPVAQAIWTVIYAAVLVLVLARCWRFLPSIFGDRALWLLHILIVLSLLWSASPDVSTKRAAALFGTSLLGVYLATRYTRADLVRLLVWSLGVAIVLSIATVVVLPDYGIDSTNPELGARGIFSQKNILGRVMALSAIVWLLYAGEHRRGQAMALMFVFLSVALLVASNSKTGLVVCAVLGLLLILAVIARQRESAALALLCALTLAIGGVAIVIAANLEGLLDTFGRNVTLTGRTELWELVAQRIQDRPWFGYGFGGFWLGWEGPSAEVWASTTWQPPDAHNGFLDTWLDLGAVGLILLIVSIVGNVRRGLTLGVRTQPYEALFPLLFIGFFLLSNITETVALTYNSILWVLYVATSIQLRASAPSAPGSAGTPARARSWSFSTADR